MLLCSVLFSVMILHMVSRQEMAQTTEVSSCDLYITLLMNFKCGDSIVCPGWLIPPLHLPFLLSDFKKCSRSITLQCGTTIKKCSLKTKNKSIIILPEDSKLVKMQKVVVFSVSSNSPCAEKREIFYSKYLPTCLLILPHQTTSFLKPQQAGSTELDALVLNSTYRHTGPRGKQCTWSAPVKYFSSTALCWCCSLPWVLSPTDLKRKKIYI